ncbi:helix-turn-helix transcriptional regulator [Stutzerimonas tarimensis]|uniref:Helix-turn-helix transcriptional regulator n=1 Tax=Stutzerimonas tarimensis TaxID=1507735 RepID=A0ABV7T0N3_9GAMM
MACIMRARDLLCSTGSRSAEHAMGNLNFDRRAVGVVPSPGDGRVSYITGKDDSGRRIEGHAGPGSGRTGDLRQRAGSALVELLDEGTASLESLAERLRLPSWTLQRRLGEHGLTFTLLLDQVRRERALLYLRQRGVSLSEMALLLGYSELSAFSRAFRRWFGMSPLQWRRRLDSAWDQAPVSRR